MPLHPVVAAMVRTLRDSGRPPLSAGSIAEARRLTAAGTRAMGSGPEVGATQDLRITTRAGSIAARLYRPQEPEMGLVVYVHGGGWALGALDDFDALARCLAERSACAVLLVDYRLAPEHPFPAGLHDVEDTVRWAAAHCGEVLGRQLPLVLAGDSAGANLATVTAIALKHELKLELQLLLYPVTDTRMDTPSYREHGSGLLLTAEDMKWFMQQYADPSLWNDSRIAPLHGHDLANVPPAWIATAEYDALRDEGDAYAARLSAAGVNVQHRCYPGLPHGFARMMNLVNDANQAVSDAAQAIRQACCS